MVEQKEANAGAGAGEAQPDPLAELKERLGPRIEEATQQLSAVNEKAKKIIRENPGTALVGAAALGFLLGRWASRK